MVKVYISLANATSSGSTFGHLFELLKNMYLTWIASVDKKVGDFRKLGVVDSAKFAYSRRFALVPCTVYLNLVYNDHNV